MFTRLIDTLKQRAHAPRSQLSFMGLASFLESTVVPIPLETVLIPYYHRHPNTLWRTALVVTLGCLAGASLFFWVGGLAMDTWGQGLVDHFSDQAAFEELKAALNENGFLLILATGISPIPFQIAMLGAGAVDYPFAGFLLAAALARGLRYFGLALLVRHYGAGALRLWHAHKFKASLLALLLLGLLYLLGRWVEGGVLGGG